MAFVRWLIIAVLGGGLSAWTYLREGGVGSRPQEPASVDRAMTSEEEAVAAGLVVEITKAPKDQVGKSDAQIPDLGLVIKNASARPIATLAGDIGLVDASSNPVVVFSDIRLVDRRQKSREGRSEPLAPGETRAFPLLIEELARHAAPGGETIALQQWDALRPEWRASLVLFAESAVTVGAPVSR